MDIVNLSLTGLVVLGVVNVLTMLRPNASSFVKFAISLVVAFGITFIPATLANELTNHLKEAVAVAFAVSGGYKLAQKAGGS